MSNIDQLFGIIQKDAQDQVPELEESYKQLDRSLKIQNYALTKLVEKCEQLG